MSGLAFMRCDECNGFGFFPNGDRCGICNGYGSLPIRAVESASPPRVPGASAQFAKVGVQSGPGQPTDICERLKQDANSVLVAAEDAARAGEDISAREWRRTADLEREAAAEIRRLRAESESRYRAGIEEAAQAAHDAVKRFTAYQSIYPAKVRDVIRALADKPPAALKEPSNG